MPLTLEKDIEKFLSIYRKKFPWTSVLPKMHILEDHAIPWLRRFHLGDGLMGEQGAESMHAHIMKLEKQYEGVHNELQHFKYISKEHQLESAPSLMSLRPPPAKRRKKNDSDEED